MVTVYRHGRWYIRVYGREHGVPHFHLDGPDWHCVIAIESLTVLIGDLPPAAVLKQVRAWAEPRRDELLTLWWKLNP
jgi:hypothetical protein